MEQMTVDELDSRYGICRYCRYDALHTCTGFSCREAIASSARANGIKLIGRDGGEKNEKDS